MQILFEINERVAFVTLNCFENNFSVLSHEALETLRETFEHIARNKNLRCVVLTCGEIDENEFANSNKETQFVSEQSQRVFDSIQNCSIPVIAALNGVVAGIWADLSLACHLRIASDETGFFLTDYSTQRLTRIVGNHANKLTGNIKADEALRMGLINRVVEQSKLLEEATSLAQTVSSLAPLAVRACLQAVTKGFDLPLQEGLELEAKLFSQLFATEDAREGTRAFLEKRQPVFIGK